MRHLIQSTPYFRNWTDLIACFDSGFSLGKLFRFSHGIRIFAILFEEPCSMKFLDCLLSARLDQLIEITVESQKYLVHFIREINYYHTVLHCKTKWRKLVAAQIAMGVCKTRSRPATPLGHPGILQNTPLMGRNPPITPNYKNDAKKLQNQNPKISSMNQ